MLHAILWRRLGVSTTRAFQTESFFQSSGDNYFYHLLMPHLFFYYDLKTIIRTSIETAFWWRKRIFNLPFRSTMPYCETAENPKSTTSLGKTKTASEEIDPRPHKYWPSVESLKAYGQKNLQATLLFVDFTKAFDSIHRGKLKQILLAYGPPKETVAAIMILYRNTKVKVRSPDGDT